MSAQDFNKYFNIEQIESAYKSGQDAFEAAYSTGKDNARKAYEAGADAVSKNWTQMIEASGQGFAKAFPQADGTFEQFAQAGRANLDAFLSASAVAMKGAETLTDELVNFGRKSVEANLKTASKATKCSSPTEFVELQNKAAREAIDTFAAEARKFGELTTKTFTEVSEPLKGRVEATVKNTTSKKAA